VTILRSGEIALLETVEFGFQLNGATGLVGVEEVANLFLDGISRRVVLHDHVHEVISKRGVNPHEDSEIGLNPGRIVGTRIVGVNVAEKIKTVENDAERAALAPKGGGLHIKSYRN
jgi:hypothetical protein